MMIWLLVLPAMAAAWMPPGPIDEFRDEFNRPLPERKVVKSGGPVATSVVEPSRCRPGMSLIAGGEFRTKQIRMFCLDTHEVTVADYQEYMTRAGEEPAKLQRALAQVSPSEVVEKRHCTWPRRDKVPRHPINCITVDEAEAFCKSHGKRLPSAQEWQWAARGGRAGYRYPGADRRPTREWLNMPEAADDRYNELREVGSYAASGSGLHDMAGNVWEWTACAKGEAVCSARGGGFRTFEEAQLRAAFAGQERPRGARSAEIGFRCASAPLKKGEVR